MGESAVDAGDGGGDCDDDNDGVPDIQDEDFDDRSDSDGDGVSNALESDDDNDGIEDGVDTDSDGDGAPDATQCALGGPRDSDADGILDYFEGDKDGDCVPDVRDRDGFEMFEPGACRFTSIPPRPRDRDQDGTRDSRDRDMDGDGIPNAKDPDVDGDLVPDARDGDANGDGIVETQDQALVTPFTVPALKAGKPTTIPRSALRTVTGQTAEVAVACKARIVNRSKGAIAPSGDIAAPTTKGLCDVVTNGDGVQITVVGDQPTRVTIKITAPATGEYKAFRQVEQVIVRSLVGRAIRKA